MKTTRLPLAIVLAAALLAFARSFDSALGLGLAIVALLTPLVTVRLDPSLERLARLLARFAVIAAVLAGWTLAIAPMLHGERTDDILRTIGFVLASCALPLAIGKPRADLAILLCAMGIFGLAGFHRLVEIRPFAAIAGLACAAHAIVTTRASVPSPRAPIGRAALSLAIAAGITTAIVFGLPPAQRRIERAILSGRVIELKGRSGLSSEDVRIGEIQSLATSDRPVLRLYGPRALRLRAHLFLRFDGRVWHAMHESHPSEPKEQTLTIGPRAGGDLARMGGPLRLFPNVAPELLAGDDVLASRIEPIELDEGLMLTPSDSLAVKTENEVRIDSLGLLVRSDRRLPDPYAIVHHRRIGVADASVPSEEERARALSLPRRIDPRVLELANRLARGDGPELLPVRVRIERTEAFLRSAARYTLQTPRYRSPDAVSELLFEHRAGYCEHFATALAVLLRLEGVPARYVTGFRVDEGDREGEHYLVRDEHAHAWVEAWVDGVGWIEADGTPMAEPTTRPRSKSIFSKLRAFFADVRAAIRYGHAADVFQRVKWPAAIALSLFGLAYVARNELRRRLAEARSTTKVREREKLGAELESIVRAIDAAFRGKGHARPRSSGLLEHAEHVEGRGIDVKTIRDAIDVLHRAAFGGEKPSSADLAATRASLRSS
jgi:transglutaminase-like putative cysteine protease